MNGPISSGPISGALAKFSPYAITPSYWRSYEPFLDENYANFRGLPDQVNRGLFKGYSFPIWSTPTNQYEELVFRLRVPFRWDETTNPYFCAITAIQGIETVGKKYRFQLEWVSEDVKHVLPATTDEIITWEVTVADGSAWYAEIIVGEMDASLNLFGGQNWQARLRRIAITSGDEVANEPVVFHWCTRWLCNKMGTVSDMGY